MEINVEEFVEKLIEKTKINKVSWKKAPHKLLKNFIDRSIIDSRIKEAYYTINEKNKDVAAVIRLEKRYYIDEEEYYTEDMYCFSLMEEGFINARDFFQGDESISSYEFEIELSRLMRMIKLKNSNIDERLNNWF